MSQAVKQGVPAKAAPTEAKAAKVDNNVKKAEVDNDKPANVDDFLNEVKELDKQPHQDEPVPEPPPCMTVAMPAIMSLWRVICGLAYVRQYL